MQKLFVLTLMLLTLSACTDTRSIRRRNINGGDFPRTVYQIKDLTLGQLTDAELKNLTSITNSKTCLLMTEEGTILGSASIITKDGLALTCSRVLEGRQKFRARFSDSSMYAAEMVGFAPTNDIALIKIHAPKSLPHFTIAPQDDLVFDQVVIAGSPYWENGSLAAGYLSGIDISRSLGNSKFLYRTLIHTAPVFKNDHGGPLMDKTGRLLGIHSSVGSSESIALSIAGILELYDDLKKGGEIAGIKPQTPLAEARMSVPGLIRFAVHESGSSSSKEILATLLNDQKKYEELYIFLRAQNAESSNRFVNMIKHDINQFSK